MSLEHLVVDLLQLEAPKGIYWHHVGGSGDGGRDGIAVNAQGVLQRSLQCKWHYSGSPASLARTLVDSSNTNIKPVVAILHGSQIADGTDYEFLNRATIASLIRKHKASLPFAKSIGLDQDI